MSMTAAWALPGQRFQLPTPGRRKGDAVEDRLILQILAAEKRVRKAGDRSAKAGVLQMVPRPRAEYAANARTHFK